MLWSEKTRFLRRVSTKNYLSIIITIDYNSGNGLIFTKTTVRIKNM